MHVKHWGLCIVGVCVLLVVGCSTPRYSKDNCPSTERYGLITHLDPFVPSYFNSPGNNDAIIVIATLGTGKIEVMAVQGKKKWHLEPVPASIGDRVLHEATHSGGHSGSDHELNCLDAK